MNQTNTSEISSLKHVLTLHKTLQNKKIILAFEGGFSHGLTKNILALTERNLKANNEETNVKKKVFNVMVECLQNIVKHIDDVDVSDYQIQDGIFMIGKDDDGYFLVSGNVVSNDSISKLEQKIKEVNSLDKAGLKELFLQTLQDTTLSDKGTAGLGLIDIARKSGQKLEYNFEKIDDKLSFYTLHTKIAIGKAT